MGLFALLVIVVAVVAVLLVAAVDDAYSAKGVARLLGLYLVALLIVAYRIGRSLF